MWSGSCFSNVCKERHSPHVRGARHFGENAPTTRSQENIVLTALILVCSLAVTPDLTACTQSNAVHTMHVPEQFGNPVTCFMHGEAFLAGTSIGQDLAEDERVKVVCVRTKRTASVAPAL